MNQEQVKEKLLKLEDKVSSFNLIFSGKESRKVNGLYKPDKKEIILHNRNFNNDNSLMYTAIHEFAHHIHFTNSPVPISSRAHTQEFWNIFHKYLIKAEKLGIYENIFESNTGFIELTREIKEKYLLKNGHLMKDFGALLVKAAQLCDEYNIIFKDYIDRGLKINSSTANTLMKIHTMDINPEIGFDNMKIVSRIKNDEERQETENAFIAGQTPDMIKAKLANKNKPDNNIEILEKEKIRIKRTIENLNIKLGKIDKELIKLKEADFI